MSVGKRCQSGGQYVIKLFPCDTGISWIEGNAEELPIATASVDAYTIAFGIRNVTRIHKVGLSYPSISS